MQFLKKCPANSVLLRLPTIRTVIHSYPDIASFSLNFSPLQICFHHIPPCHFLSSTCPSSSLLNVFMLLWLDLYVSSYPAYRRSLHAIHSVLGTWVKFSPDSTLSVTAVNFFMELIFQLENRGYNAIVFQACVFAEGIYLPPYNFRARIVNANSNIGLR